MGTAFARALLTAGHRVAVWNRTVERAEALTAAGAEVLASAGDALAASPLAIVCIGSTDDVRELLEAVDPERIRGKAILNVTSGTPDDARSVRNFALQHGIFYLDAAICAYPEQIGTAEARILVAGDESLWQAHSAVVRDLAGSSMYVGADHGAANAIDAALTGAFYITSLVSYVEAARFVSTFGIPQDVLISLSSYSVSVLDHQMKLILDRIAAGDFSTDQATLSVYADAAEAFSAGLSERGKAPMIQTTARVLRDAVDAGLGAEDISVLSTLTS
jgi:3-hydroxyisobutyrate dehydrogenase-like beta-hydroxyacid dehydrogenase